jgi:hypothetical protein
MQATQECVSWIAIAPPAGRTASAPAHQGLPEQPVTLLEQPICLLLRQGRTAGCNARFADHSLGNGAGAMGWICGSPLFRDAAAGCLEVG